MPVYPGTEPPVFAPANSYEKDGFKETRLSMFSHTGTHIDPPAHIFGNKKSLDRFPAGQFVGKGLVIDCRYLADGALVTIEHIKKYGDLADKADFLLFNFGWDKKWGTDEYFGNYPCIDVEVLDMIIEGDYKGIGFDVIGLDPIADVSMKRHNKLFANKEIINIENLKDLERCGCELFTFCCLPITVEDSDGAPARAIAILD